MFEWGGVPRKTFVALNVLAWLLPPGTRFAAKRQAVVPLGLPAAAPVSTSSTPQGPAAAASSATTPAATASGHPTATVVAYFFRRPRGWTAILWATRRVPLTPALLGKLGLAKAAFLDLMGNPLPGPPNHLTRSPLYATGS
jgi:hypothetical protein